MYLMKSNIKKDKIQSLIFFLMGISLLIYSLKEHHTLGISWDISPYLFPLLISVFLIVLPIILFLQTTKHNIKEDKGMDGNNEKGLVLVLLLSILYYFLLAHIGFMFSSIGFLALLFIVLGERRWWMIATVSVFTSLLLEGIFVKLLNVMLP